MKYSKNNKINIKLFVLVIFAIVIISSAPIVKAEINNTNLSENQQLITLLKQLIILLMKQIEVLQKQIIAKQQIIENSKVPALQITSSTQQILDKFEIISVNITSGIDSAKIEWQTTKPAESKIYVSGYNLSSKMFLSESGFSLKHIANIKSLSPIMNYSYEITAINESGFIRKTGIFMTLNAFLPDIMVDKGIIKNDDADYAIFTIITKLSNGEILPNKSIKINNQTYISDNNGIIIYKTTPTTYWDKCGNYNRILVVITENGDKNYSYSIGIENVQPVQKGGGIIVCP